jgi:hypothetical protein
MQQPRQMYGLGSFVKKAVKGVTGAVKKAAKSDLGKAALLAAGTYGLGGGTFFGKSLPFLKNTGGFAFGNILPNLGGIMGLKSGKDALLGNTLKVGLAGTLLGGALSGMPGQDVAEMTDQGRSQQDIESIKIRLTKAYRELGYSEDQIPALVEADLSEYSTRGFADGGRIGFQQGGNFDFNKFLQDRTREAMQVQGIGQAIRPVVESNVRAQAARDLSQAAKGGGIESFLRGQLGSGIIPGMSAMQSPMTGTSKFGRQQVIDALTKSYMTQYSAPTDSAYDQMRFAAPGQSGSFVEMQGGQYAPYGSGSGQYGIVIDGKQYATEQDAIDDVGLERYNMFYADGGRIGYEKGTPEMGMMDPEKVKQAQTMIKMGSDVSTISSITGLTEAQVNQIKQTQGKANGGRIGYAYGNKPEDNAMQASGVMGLPLNQNPAGVTELDLRDSGGFIPPVGVKEKADDIPAMLSNNEFVFTADAVRGMGDGDVNKGAQRMYDMMKKLENGGRV